MNGKICFTRDAHGLVQLDGPTLRAFYAANRPGAGHGGMTRVQRELRDVAAAEFAREFSKVAAQMGSDLGDTQQYDAAFKRTVAIHPELYFTAQCQLSDSDADSDVSLQVAR